MISVLILTKNEQQDLAGCLESVRWCDDIHVYDSHSTDETVPIARSFGATVTQRQFDDWSSHQNWGIRNIGFKYPWVFYLDADERATEPLVASMQKAVQSPGLNIAFRMQRRDFFLRQWLKNVQATQFYIRLFQPRKMHYERLVNPVSIPDGPVGELVGYLDHFPFSKGVTHWLDRHNAYSTLEARQIVANRAAHVSFSFRKAFSGSRMEERRFHQKEIFYRIPGRPLAKFTLLYIFRGGFLDRGAGLAYAILQSFYEYMIVLKTRELASKASSDGTAALRPTVGKRLNA